MTCSCGKWLFNIESKCRNPLQIQLPFCILTRNSQGYQFLQIYANTYFSYDYYSHSAAAAAAAKSLQSCPTLCDPMDCSLLGSSIHGIFQATVLEWGAIAFSNMQLISPLRQKPKKNERTSWWKWKSRVKKLLKAQDSGN